MQVNVVIFGQGEQQLSTEVNLPIVLYRNYGMLVVLHDFLICILFRAICLGLHRKCLFVFTA